MAKVDTGSVGHGWPRPGRFLPVPILVSLRIAISTMNLVTLISLQREFSTRRHQFQRQSELLVPGPTNYAPNGHGPRDAS